MKIAANFDRKMKLPNFAGVIYPHVFVVHDPEKKVTSVACAIRVLDANGRISCSWARISDISPPQNELVAITNAVARCLESSDLRLPTPKLKFIGGQDCGHFSPVQILRGLQLRDRMDLVLKDRFAFLGKDIKVSGQVCTVLEGNSGMMSEVRGYGIVFALAKLHNFLVDKSPTYGDVFKDLAN